MSDSSRSNSSKSDSSKSDNPKSDQLKKGDAVEWKSSQGKVEKKLTEPTDIKGHHVNASKDDPQYLVKSDKTGAEAAHKPESLKKTED